MAELSKLPVQLDVKSAHAGHHRNAQGCRNKFDYDPDSGLFILAVYCPKG